MGTFQERLKAAIQEVTDTLTIWRHGSENGGVNYEIEISRHTTEFGTLYRRKQLPVEDATPGRLMGVIELISEGLSSAVETIETAKK